MMQDYGRLKTKFIHLFSRQWYIICLILALMLLFYSFLDFMDGFSNAMLKHYVVMPFILFLVVLPLSLIITYVFSCIPGAKYFIGI